MKESPITLSSKNENHMITLLTVLEDEFRKSYGDPIVNTKVVYNETFKKLLEDNRYVDREESDREWVCRFLEDVITHN